MIDPSGIDEENIFEYDAVHHDSVYWTISRQVNRESVYVVFNPCSVGPTLPTSQNTSDFTKFNFTPV